MVAAVPGSKVPHEPSLYGCFWYKSAGDCMFSGACPSTGAQLVQAELGLPPALLHFLILYLHWLFAFHGLVGPDKAPATSWSHTAADQHPHCLPIAVHQLRGINHTSAGLMRLKAFYGAVSSGQGPTPGRTWKSAHLDRTLEQLEQQACAAAGSLRFTATREAPNDAPGHHASTEGWQAQTLLAFARSKYAGKVGGGGLHVSQPCFQAVVLNCLSC